MRKCFIKEKQILRYGKELIMSYSVDVKIEGTSPLLQHRFDVENKERKSKRKAGSVDYSDEVEKAIYRDEAGQIYQPASHIEGALMKAAVNFQISGKGKKTYKDLIKMVIVEPFAIPHLQDKFKVDRHAVVVNRARIIRCRPRFDQWSLKFTMLVQEDQLPIEVLQEILEYAGRLVGIGDWRPRFGRFRIVEFKKVA